MWLEVEKNQRLFVIGGIYRHPGPPPSAFIEKLEKSLDTLKNENKTVILCGDINIDLLHPNKPATKQYTDALFSVNIIPCITLPTRITDHSATLIDHINIPRPIQHIEDNIISGNLFLGIADHLPNFIYFIQ